LALSGSDLYVGGNFAGAGGVPVYRVAKWNGSSWSGLGKGVSDFVKALTVSGTNLYVGGFFDNVTNVDGTAVPAKGIARWDGANWSAFGSGAESGVTALLLDQQDHLLVGGRFLFAGDKCSPFFAQVNLAQIPPHLENCRLTDGRFCVDLDSETGSEVVLEASTDLRYWTPIATNTIEALPITFTEPQGSADPQRFFRLIQQ
jgi:hypothetical protein